MGSVGVPGEGLAAPADLRVTLLPNLLADTPVGGSLVEVLCRRMIFFFTYIKKTVKKSNKTNRNE